MSTDTMKAVRLHAFGGPDMLRYEDAPRPELAAGEVLVRVHAASLNPPDLYLRDGYRAMPPEWRPDPAFPLIIGTDVSDVVEAVAYDVMGFNVCDDVYAMGSGSSAPDLHDRDAPFRRRLPESPIVTPKR